MQSRLVATPGKSPPSNDELSFYLPRLITTYTSLAQRRQRRLVLGLTSWLTACVIAYGVPSSSEIALPVISTKVAADIAVGAVYIFGSMLFALSLFDKCAIKAYREELKAVHALRYKTEPPLWYLRAPSYIETAELLGRKTWLGRVSFILVAVVAASLLLTVIFYHVTHWSQLSLASRILFATGTTLFAVGGSTQFRLLKSSEQLLQELRHGSSLGSDNASIDG